MAAITNLELVAIHNLKPATYNPRTIAADMLAKLKKGIAQYGLVEPLVINRDGTVIGGHQRLKAAQELGLTEVPCVRLDLDPQSEKALNLALNKLSGEWDFAKLSDLLGELQSDLDLDIELTGFDNIEMAGLVDFNPGDLSGLPGFDSTLSGAGAEIPDKAGKAVVQYTIVFNDEDEQKIWHAHLKALKERYPDEDTISARLIRDIQERADG